MTDPHAWPTPTAKTLADALRAQAETDQETRMKAPLNTSPDAGESEGDSA